MIIYIILLVIVAACLGVIIYVAVRKFPQVANLDLANLPQEKIYQKKREIINKRIQQSGYMARRRLSQAVSPIKKIWGLLQLKFRIYVGKIERLLHHEQILKDKMEKKIASTGEQEQKFRQLVSDGEQYLKISSFDLAEDAFIAAIKIKPKSPEAYRGLGDTYLAKNSLEEAKQTYLFLHQLEPDNDAVLVKLAEVAEAQNKPEEAIGYYQQAVLLNDSFSARFYRLAELLVKVGQPDVAKEAILQATELEPQNPKYLDLLIEIAIICGDKAMGLKAYNDLRLVNPENQKLDSLKDRIYRLEDSGAPPAKPTTPA